jgi:membrane-bound lytic murein transglycosylase D
VLGLVAASRDADLRRSLSAALTAWSDPALVEGALEPPPPPARIYPPLLVVPEVDDGVLDLELATDFSGALRTDLGSLGAIVLELAPRRLRIPITRRTVRYVRFFAEHELGRAAITHRLTRLGRTREVLEDELRKAGLLEELVAVAAIESGFDARALSPAGAAGVWQLMPKTATAYGLVVQPDLDERRNVRKASRAAAEHLRDLYDHYERWDLALAAYNAGITRIDRAIARYEEIRAPELAGVPVSFADLASARLIPQETADYVPKVTAFAILLENQDYFGLRPVEQPEPLRTAELTVPPGTSLEVVARSAECSLAELRDLNPDLLGARTPMLTEERAVLVPAESISRALATFEHYARLEARGELHDDAKLALGVKRPDEAAPPAIRVLSLDEARRAFGTLEARGDAGAPSEATSPRPSWLGASRLPLAEADAQREVARLLSPGAASAATEAPGLLDPNARAVALASLSQPGRSFATLSALDASSRFANPEADRARPSSGDPRLDGAVDKLIATYGAPADAASPAALVAIPAAALAPRRPVEHFAVKGIEVELERDDERKTVRLELRTSHVSGSSALSAFGTSWVIDVAPRELDVVPKLLESRLRLASAEGSHDVVAALRRSTHERARRELSATPYGVAWLGLGDALFPEGHPLEGTLVGARHDAEAATDAQILLHLLARDEAPLAELRIEGPLDREAVRALLAGVSRPPARGSSARTITESKRTEVLVDGPDPRLYVGWVAPEEGSLDDLAQRAALELLANKKIGRLRRALVEEREIAAELALRLEPGPRGGYAVLELRPTGLTTLGALEDALSRELERLGTSAIEGTELTYVRGLLRSRVEEQSRTAASGSARGADWATTSARLRRALDPARFERELARVGELDASRIQRAARELLALERSVIVTALPRTGAVHSASIER